MNRIIRFLSRVILLGVLAVSMAMPNLAWGQRVTITPGKDSQVFRPEPPGYGIKKDQDKVEEYMKVPPPPMETKKKKEKEAQGKEIDGK